MGRKGRYGGGRYNNHRRRYYDGKNKKEGGDGGGAPTIMMNSAHEDETRSPDDGEPPQATATTPVPSSSRSSSHVSSSPKSSSSSSLHSSSRHCRSGWDREPGRDELHRYLAEYKKLALRSHSLASLLSIQGWWRGSSSKTTTTVVVGGVSLPELNSQVLQGPCLPFPSTLTSRQRRIVHELCTELDLFHCTVDMTTVVTAKTGHEEETPAGEGGEEADDEADDDNEAESCRTVLVSPYADGFDDACQLTNAEAATTSNRPPSAIVPAYRFVPWYSKYSPTVQDDEGDVDIDDVDVDGWRDRTYLVEALWDQPGECLRPDRDSIDFCALEHDTLESLGLTKKAKNNKPQALGSDPNHVPWMLVDTPERLRECVDELSTAREVGFDVEAYNKSKTCQLTCLLQIKAGDTGKEYVIDPLAPGMWESMRYLRPVFEDPHVVKVGHSIGSLDVKSLHRDFGIWVVNAFDTYEAAKTLLHMDNTVRAATSRNSHNTSRNHGDNDSNGLGLTAVCQRYGAPHVAHHRRLKSKYQKCDWRARPLTLDMLEYGRLDVRHLLDLRILMMRDLTRGELYDKRLDQLRQESRLVAEALEAVARMEDAYEHAHFAAVQNPPGGLEPLEAAPSAPANTSNAFEPTLDPLCDDETFKTSHQRDTFSAKPSTRSVGEAGYFTAASSLSLSDDEDDDGAGDFLNGMPRKSVVLSPAVVASADTLRRQPRLMQVLTSSQERCLSLWSQSRDRNRSNNFEKSLLDLWFCQQKDHDDWDDSNVHLYLALVEWRAQVADELGCHEDFVVDLEFLVHVAWRKPTSVWALRRVAWTLPDVLLDYDEYRSRLLRLVRKHKSHDDVGRGDNDEDGDGDDIVFYRAVSIRHRRSRALVAATVVACAAAALIVTASRRVKHR